MPAICQEERKAKTKWDEAIADAKLKIKRLEQAIEVYRKMKKNGDSWPSPATRN